MKAAFEMLWPDMPMPARRPGVGAPPGFRPGRTPSELKADETTRVARETTDAATEARRAHVARLRQARLDYDDDGARAAMAPPAAKRRDPRG